MPTEPRKMNFIIIGLCTQGEIMYQLDGQMMMIKPGDVLIVSEKHVVDSYQHSPDMKGLCMMISMNFFQEIIQSVKDISAMLIFARVHPVMHMEPEEMKTFKSYFRVIKQKLADKKNHFHKDLIRALLLAMLYDLGNMIYRVQRDGPHSKAEITFERFIRLVEDNFRTERRVSWYSEQLDITAKYLCETVKNVSHQTPSEWIDKYVLMEMRVLLRNTKMSIGEVAEELQYPDQSFLGKFFKKHTGMTPKDYRKS